MLLSEARAEVRTHLDDLTGQLATDVQVDAALTKAQYDAAWLYVSAGGTLMLQETTITTNGSGVADLSTIKPLKIHNVALSTGGYRQRILPINIGDIESPYSGVQTLIVSYSPRMAFPAGPTLPFVWGNAAVILPPLDDYTCVCAAVKLKAIDGEVNQVLVARQAELKAEIAGLINNPSWTAMPMRSRAYCLFWAETQIDTLQLCY